MSHIKIFKGRALALGFLCLSLLISCNTRVEKGGGESPLKSSNKFEIINEKIFKAKCLNCHTGANASDHVDLSDYAEVMASEIVIPLNPEASPLYKTLASGKMPKGGSPLSKEDIQLVYDWIKAGAKEVDTQVAPTPPVEEKPTFTSVSKILKTRCLVCHNTDKPRGKVDVTSYDTLIKSPGNEKKTIVPGDSEKSGLFIEVEEQSMPPTPKMLNAEETKALYDWIAQGALEKTPGTPPLPGPNQPNPPRPTYEWLSKNIFSRRCGSCHGIPFKVAKVDFSNYQTLLGSTSKGGKALVPNDPENSLIYKEITKGSMPPARKGLSKEEVELIEEWIDDGALNN